MPWKARPALDDQLRRGGEAGDDCIGLFAERLAIAPVDKDRAAVCCPGASDVAPAIADQRAARKIDPQSRRGAEEHAGLRLSAHARFAMFARGMEADFTVVEHGEGQQKTLMDCVYLRARLRPAADSG